MEIAELALMIPITALILSIGGSIVKSILNSQERRLEMQLRLRQGQSTEVMQAVQALRAEVAALRDTSTQFDLSLDQTVQALERRVGGIETKPHGYATTSEELTQPVGAR